MDPKQQLIDEQRWSEVREGNLEKSNVREGNLEKSSAREGNLEQRIFSTFIEHPLKSTFGNAIFRLLSNTP